MIRRRGRGPGGPKTLALPIPRLMQRQHEDPWTCQFLNQHKSWSMVDLVEHAKAAPWPNGQPDTPQFALGLLQGSEAEVHRSYSVQSPDTNLARRYEYQVSGAC